MCCPPSPPPGGISQSTTPSLATSGAHFSDSHFRVHLLTAHISQAFSVVAISLLTVLKSFESPSGQTMHIFIWCTQLSCIQAADAESSSLHKTVEGLRQGAEKAVVESRQASQQWAVAQADSRATRHQLKLLQQQVTPHRLQLSDYRVIEFIVLVNTLTDMSTKV